MAIGPLQAGCSNPMQRAGNFAAIAESNLQAGNLEEARANIRKAISERDDIAEYYIILGRTELAAKSLVSAFNAYSMALDLQADNAEALQSIAEIGLQIGRIDEASEAADRILLLAPGSVNAMLVKGFISIDNGQLDEADNLATEILAANPDDEGGSILLARVKAIKGKDQEALELVDQAIAKSGATQALGITKLEILRLRSDATGMRKLFPQIIEKAGDTTNYRTDYINLLYKMGDANSARREVLEAIRMSPNDRELFSTIGRLWSEYDSNPLTPAQISTISNSATRVTQTGLATNLYQLGNYTAAKQIIASLTKSGNLPARALLAKIELALGNEKVAYALADDILGADATNEDALIVRSARALKKKNFDRAAQDASLAITNAPQDYEAYVQLAKTYMASGNTIRARQTYENGLDALPQSYPLAAAYERFLRQVDDRARILSTYGELAAATPSSVHTWRAYRRVCTETNQTACTAKADSGLLRAQRSFMIDDVPGSPKRRGLFARITPERICAITGGVCTDS